MERLQVLVEHHSIFIVLYSMICFARRRRSFLGGVFRRVPGTWYTVPLGSLKFASDLFY